MTPAGPRSAVDLDGLTRLREQEGLSYRLIACRLGISEGYVAWLCLVNGIERNGRAGVVRDNVGPMIVGRGAHVIRRFGAAEDARLRALEADGLSYGEIARTLGRCRNSVTGRLATLARRDARLEAVA